MIKTPFTEFIGIDHPVALAGMAGATSTALVAAVSAAGGLGILGVSGFSLNRLESDVAAIRHGTDRPFGLNCLLHNADDEAIRDAVKMGPAVLSTAWPREDQDLRSIFAVAHDRGIKVMHMVPSADDAARAAEAGADVIVAQGTDGGGHIGLIGTVVIVPAVVRAVAPVPVLGAGGIADGRGLAAMLALGAAGVLVGTRFLATPESPLLDSLKQLIVEHDAADTMVTDVADIMLGSDWPGAMERVLRNRAVERWLGRENELRRHRESAYSRMAEARGEGDVEESIVYMGQSAALIDGIVPAAQVVIDLVQEAERILARELPGLVQPRT